MTTRIARDSFNIHWHGPVVPRTNICKTALLDALIPGLDNVQANMFTPEPSVLTDSYGALEPPYDHNEGDVGQSRYIDGVDCSVILRAPRACC